jgi:hypothetical protein
VPIERRSRSIWANPFLLGDDGDRPTVIANYGWYFERKPSLQTQLPGLRGKVLGCWCYPLRCHGNLLIELLG